MSVTPFPLPKKEPHALVRYDAMCRAITEAHAVDEVKDIRDKAQALEIYYRQARNLEAEKKAAEIRIRAERRCGELLKEMKKRAGARGMPGPGRGHKNGVPSCDPVLDEPTLGELGISKTQSSRMQRLAEVPQEDFEAAFRSPIKPTTGGILTTYERKINPPSQAEPDAAHRMALYVWGVLDDLIKRQSEATIKELAAAMADDPVVILPMTRKMLPDVIDWLTRLQKELETEERR